MPQVSSIDRLPSEVREALDGWLRDPAITQTEAAERTNALLDELGAQRPEEIPDERVSRLAVHRYDQRMRAACERMRQSREVIEAWSDKLGSAPAGQFGHFFSEMMRMLVFDLGSQLQDREIDEESLPGIIDGAAKISLMAQRLEHSREIAVRCDREIKRQADEEAEKAKAAKRPPITPERMMEVIREAYGFEPQSRKSPSAAPAHHDSPNQKHSSS